MDQSPVNCLSLCSGGAGLDLGVALVLGGLRTRCYVEREAFAVSYLLWAMDAGWLDQAPVWTDLKTFDGRPWRRRIHIVLGGYPCQPLSCAGKRAGRDDPRHLWPDIRRVLGEVEPPLCFFENVSGHLSLGFDEVARDLEDMGYSLACGIFTAAEVGASHKRERLFILGYADRWDGDGRGIGGAIIDPRERAVVQSCSYPGRLKHHVRRAFCRLVIKAMHRRGVEVNLTVS